jgi:hypothetical protein
MEGSLYDFTFFTPILKYMSNIIGYQEWCLVNHPSADSYRCAHAYFWAVRKEKLYQIDAGDQKLFYDYSNLEEAQKPNYVIKGIALYTLYLGLLLYLLEISIPPKFLGILGFCFSLGLALPYQLVWLNLGGVDTIAYINQAGAALNG